MRLTVLFEPRPWIKRRACSRSRTVAPVLHYFRVLRGAFAPSSKKMFNKWISSVCVVVLQKVRCMFLFGASSFRWAVRVSLERDPYDSKSGQVTYSQPVLKKLVCDNSTPFHVWMMCGEHLIQACIMTKASSTNFHELTITCMPASCCVGSIIVVHHHQNLCVFFLNFLGVEAKKMVVFAPRLELGTSRVWGERHNQLDHANCQPPTRIELVTFSLRRRCSANWAIEA